MPFDPKTDPLMKGSTSKRLEGILRALRGTQDRVQALEAAIGGGAGQATIDELREDLRNLELRQIEDERINAEQTAALAEHEATIEALKAAGSGGGTAPPPAPAPVLGEDPGDGPATKHAHLVWLARTAADGDTIRIQGKVKTSIAFQQNGLTVEGVSLFPGVDGLPQDELIWDAALVNTQGLKSDQDKGILVFFQPADRVKAVPDGDLVIRNLVLRGAKSADGNGAGIRVSSSGSGASTKPVYRHVTVENVWCILCQNGGLTVCAGDLTLRNVHSSLWGRGGDGIHGWYHTNQNVVTNTSRLIIRGYYSEGGAAGHGIKWRCGFADIDGLYINRDGPPDNESYEVECCQGGIVKLRNFFIRQGKKSQNKAVFSYGAERSKGQYPVNRIEILEGDNTMQTDVALVRDHRFFSFGSGTEGKPWNRPAANDDGTPILNPDGTPKMVPAVEIYGLARIKYVWNPPSLRGTGLDPLRDFKQLDYAPAA